MAEITASLVKELRDKTGAGMMDCKKALKETNGDIAAASDWLRKTGLLKAANKASRVAAAATGSDAWRLVPTNRIRPPPAATSRSVLSAWCSKGTVWVRSMIWLSLREP